MTPLSYAPCRRVSFAMLLCASCLVLSASMLGAAPVSEEVPVPGGTAALSRALGLDSAPEPARFITELIRVIYDPPDGTSAATDRLLRNLTNYLKSTGTAGPGARAATEIVQAATVPVPLSAKVWSDAVFQRPIAAADLFPAIIADRRAALLCYGLAALDDETLQFLSKHPALVARLYERDASIFAAFAGSLRVRRNAIVLPGGDAARPLWEAALNEPAASPERFLGALFSRDNGRVAYLYDALGQFDRPTSDFSLGLWIDDRGRRLERFTSLLKALDAFPGWVVPERPFRRPSDDPVLMMMRVPAAPDGEPTGPSWRAFWTHAFASTDLPDDPDRQLRAVRSEGRIDAAWLAEAILAAELQSRGERLDQLAFGLRAFSAAGDGMLADALVAVRAFPRYRMLMLTLERMDIANPAVYAAAARQAVRLSSLDANRGVVALGQFQGALAILARLVDTHVLEAGDAERLAVALCAVPLNADGSYAGGVARWLQRSLAPAVGIRIDDFDGDLIASLAGVRHGNPPTQPPAPRLVVWEQSTYALDLTTAEERRVTRVLEKLQADSISLALALEATAEQLSARGVTLADVKTATASLTAAQAALERRRSGRGVAGRWIEDLSKITTSKDLRKTGQVADSVYEAVDDVLGDALISVAYALALGDPQGTILFAGNVSRRHDFGVSNRNGEIRLRAPWTEPEPQLQPGIPWHVRGSLLGLDLGLSSLAVRRTSLGALPEAPTLKATDKDIFTKTIALLNMFELHDGDRDAIAEAIARGRERLVGLFDHDEALDRLADEIKLDGWRRRAVRWSLAHDPQRVPGLFSLSELMSLGTPQASATFRAWGMAASAYDGCICTVLTPPGRWALGAGRWPRGTVATHVADLNLRIAVALADLNLPAPLAKGVLASAMQDYVDRVKPLYPDDWLTLVRSAQALSLERIQDYIAALTINGPLVPDSSEDDSRDSSRGR